MREHSLQWKRITRRKVSGALLVPVALSLLTGCPLIPPSEPPPAAVLEGTWSITPAEPGDCVDCVYEGEFDSNGNLVELRATRPDGATATLTTDDATTVLDGNGVVITVQDPTGARVFEGTLSDDENTMVGSITQEIDLGDLEIKLPGGELTFERVTAGDPCEGVSCEADETCIDGECVPEGPAKAAYVGTDTCLTCHGEGSSFGDKSNFMLTGHPFKIVPTDGEAPTYPITGTLPSTPPGLEWTDTAYVIGGFRWKYRVMDTDGYVVLGPTAQYNFPSEELVAYDNTDSHTTLDGTPGPWEENIGRKPFDCGNCHTTGYDADTENRRGLEGLVGDWEFDGIHCEECHGAGGDHVTSMSAADINSDPDTETVCGKCHTRSADGIAASGGFVKHHEQWDEFSRSVHASVMPNGCMTCHDTHEPIFDQTRLAAIQAALEDPTAVDNLEPPPGIIAECTDCHAEVNVVHPGPTECIACHMAFTGKSGQSINANMGDIRGHVWRIDDNADTMMFTDVDGNPVARDSGNTSFAALDDEGKAFITLDFACLRCHTDEEDTLEWAANASAMIHP